MSDIPFRFHVQTTAKQLRNGFPYFSEHDSISALWAEKWKEPCSKGVFPFMDGNIDDFQPIIDALISVSGDQSSFLYRSDDYARIFLPKGDELIERAEASLAAGRRQEARELFLRAAAVYRIARYPCVRTAVQQEVWAKNKAAYEQGGLLLDPPSVAIDVPFDNADEAAGDEARPIPAYLRVPTGERPAGGWPLLIFICGLDAYKTDHTLRTNEHVERGYAVLSIEIPGTADCPASPSDPAASDRLVDAVLAWVGANAPDKGIDAARLVVRAVSTGGYHAFRLAHTHADRFIAVAAEGGGCHHMFDPAWIEAQDQMGYPFMLREALAWKFGFRGPDLAANVERYKAEGRRFSLFETGVLERPSCRMLVINGMEDTTFPSEDSILFAQIGRGKDLVILADRDHMGAPAGQDEESIVYDWIDRIMSERP